jgi:hypothetical protein
VRMLVTGAVAEWDGGFPRDGQIALLSGDVCDEQLGCRVRLLRA